MQINYSLGLDIGSEFVHAALLKRKSKDNIGVVSTPESIMHLGNPVSVIQSLYQKIIRQIPSENLSIAFTGGCGKMIADSIQALYCFETTALPQSASLLNPEAKYLFHIGAKNPYFFELEHIGSGLSGHYASEVGTGTKCGGGSGILITKQCRRFFDNGSLQSPGNNSMYSLAYNLALQADKDIDVGGRCGVVINSDMIHLQNSGESIKNILRGFFERLAINYKSDVIRLRDLDKKQSALVTGGVCANPYIVSMLEKHLGIKIQVHEYHQQAGAIGAALKSFEAPVSRNVALSGLEHILEAERSSIRYAPPLSSALGNVEEICEKPLEKIGNVLKYMHINGKTQTVLGLDGGSTTTKALLVKIPSLETVAGMCIETRGQPVEAAQKIFQEFHSVFNNSINIAAVGYTGSSASFYHRLFTDLKKCPDAVCADIVKDEITCHALGVKQYCPDVDTIFELGGQDAKFTYFNNGVVRKAKMNLSCMAGTGQAMQNMIKMLGLDFEQFDAYALRALQTPIADDSCGVFTEADITKFIGLGLPKDEIAAAIAYACIGGYINKFVGNEPKGSCISAQGGPFRSKACLAALAMQTGNKIHAFPYRQLFGAYGAAISAYNNLMNQ